MAAIADYYVELQQPSRAASHHHEQSSFGNQETDLVNLSQGSSHPQLHSLEGGNAAANSPPLPSYPPSDTHTQAQDSLTHSFFYPAVNKYRCIALCLAMVTTGMNDGAPGALIPAMEKYYNVGYGVIATIFLGNALGFILVAAVSNRLQSLLGRKGTFPLGAALMVVSYSTLVCTPPYPLVVVSFLFAGAGMALILAQMNTFLASLQSTSTLMGKAVSFSWRLPDTP
jgi:fucose permease